jgi:hypothetical protein
MIQDRFDSVLFVFSVDGGWIRWNPAGKQFGIISVRKFQSSSMDFGVNPKFRRQFESVVRGFWLGL